MNWLWDKQAGWNRFVTRRASSSACYLMSCSSGWEGEGVIVCVYDRILTVLQWAARGNRSDLVKQGMVEWVPKAGMSPVWTGPSPLQSLTAMCFHCRECHSGMGRGGGGVVLVQTQRRCSSKGSSVVSFRGVGGSPVFSRVGSIVWVTPRGSCVRLTSCKGAGGAGCKRWDWFFRAIYIYIFLSRHVPYRARLHRTLYYSQRADFEFWPMSCQRCSTTRLNTLLNCLVNAM